MLDACVRRSMLGNADVNAPRRAVKQAKSIAVAELTDVRSAWSPLPLDSAVQP